MKKYLLCSLTIAVLVIAYFLFEPIFVYNFGWKDLPEIKDKPTAGGDSVFRDAIDEAERIIREARHTLRAPAFSAAVGIEGKAVWREAIGLSNIEHAVTADTTTMFRIGSTSKAVTSVALGKFLEQGKLQLDKPVQYYVPYVALEKPVTIRQLASHTSGIREYGLCLCFPIWEYYSNDAFETIRESAEVFQHDPLLFEPGTQYSYSTYNTTLVSAALEETGQKKFLPLMHDEVFTPLGMHHTMGDYADSIIAGRATFYEIRNGQYKPVYAVDNSNKWAGGGFLSTPGDLVKLGNGLLSHRILKASTLDTLFMPQKLKDGTHHEEYYALGWRSFPEKKLFDGTRITHIVHHGGTAAGSTAFLVLLPEYKMTVAIMMNRNAEGDFRDFSGYAFKLAEAFIGADSPE
jgi:CubicO group peptidase (beta-lactamase class C family)